jgi:hypothetical protein
MPFGGGYKLTTVRRYPGLVQTVVGVFARAQPGAP